VYHIFIIGKEQWKWVLHCSYMHGFQTVWNIMLASN